MLNFCTLFDYNYIHFGLLMYHSLLKKCDSFHLYIYAFDDKAYEILSSLQLKHITLVSLKEFEDERLLSVKPLRTRAEYCWTSTPSTILYAIEKFNLDHCTYIDADMFFFGNPKALIDEMGDASILLTAHNYYKKYEHNLKAGIYCVQFMTFKNDEKGLKALSWWRDACIDWCYARFEDDKFGDQKYLDDWTTRFEGVHVAQHKGGGVAPWNVQKYTILQEKEEYFVKDKQKLETSPIIFYHFHDLKFIDTYQVNFGRYDLNNNVLTMIYKPYFKKLLAIKTKYHTSEVKKATLFDYFIQKIRIIKKTFHRSFSKSYNVYFIKQFDA